MKPETEPLIDPLAAVPSKSQRGTTDNDQTIDTTHTFAPPDPAADSPQLVAKYQIKKLLGRGGQASVFLAWDPDLQRQVVIKLYHGAKSSEQQEAVLREGRSLVRIEDQHVGRCFAVDRHGGTPYLVMEYIPGAPLSQLLVAGRWEVARSLDLVRAVARGLEAVHAQGILHRDIKPSNILIGEDGIPRLIDFGLAVPGSDASEAGISGTVAYMAPEQARGDRLDTRTDLFSLGAVLYEILVGQPPYSGSKLRDVWEQARRGEIVPPTERNPSIPAEVNALCLASLAKAPAQRPASATDFIHRIDKILGSADTPHAKSKLRGWQWPAVAAVATGVLVLGIIVVATIVSGLPYGTPTRVITPTTGNQLPPNIKPAGTGSSRPLHQDFTLSVEVLGAQPLKNGKVVLTEGSAIAVRLVADRDCYVGVWSIQPNAIVQIFPNAAEANHFLEANLTRQIPGPPDVPGQPGKILRVTTSAGKEFLHVVAVNRPLPAVEGKKLGPYVVIPDQLRAGPWQFSMRGVELIDKPVDSGGQALLISEAIIPYEVQPRSESGSGTPAP